jgi:YD repeat-containing protein
MKMIFRCFLCFLPLCWVELSEAAVTVEEQVRDYSSDNVQLGNGGSLVEVFPIPANTVSYSYAVVEGGPIPETVLTSASVSNNTLYVTVTDDGTNTYDNNFPGADIVSVSAAFVISPPTQACEALGDRIEGNPISIPAGVKIETATDYVHANPLLSFSRNYVSSLNQWHYSYDRHLEIKTYSDNNIDTLYIRHGDDGSVHAFSYTDPTADRETFIFYSSDKRATLTRNEDESLYFYAYATTVETYDAASGQLLTITTPEHQVRVSHTETEKNITDGFGNQLIIGKPVNNTFTVTDGDVILTYTLANDLLASVTFADGSQKQYVYGEDPDYPEALSGVIDESNQRYATFGYDAEHRANLSTHANGVDQVVFVYETDRVIETNALGKRTIYHLQTVRGRDRITHVEGVSSVNCASSDSYQTYDGKGYLQTKTDAKSNVTYYEYDTKGRATLQRSGYRWVNNTPQYGEVTDVLTQLEVPAETPDILTETRTCWNDTHSLPERVIEPYQVTRFEYYPDGRLENRIIEERTASNGRCL